MGQICSNFVMYLVELIKLSLMVLLIFHIKIKSTKRMLITTLFSFSIVAVLAYFGDLSYYGMSYGIVSITLFFFNLQEKKRIGFVILSYVLVCTLDMVMAAIILFGFQITYSEMENDFSLFVSMNCISLCLIMIYLVVNRRKQTVRYHIANRYILLMIICGLSIGLYITAVQLVAFEGEFRTPRAGIGLAVSASILIFIIICFKLISNQTKNEYLERENVYLRRESELTERLLKSQEDYYVMLSQKQEEIKVFRHDIRQHFYAMLTLCEKGDYKKLEEYFSKMGIVLQNMEIAIHTGNDLVDAMLSDIGRRYPEVNIEWKGKLDERLNILQIDLCTIFSNLISNAFEAAQQCENKQVKVSVNVLESTLFVCIGNTTMKEPNVVEGDFVSSKNEPEHGYGIKSVKKCLYQYQGIYEYHFEHGFFTAEIVIPNVIPL